MPVFGPPNIEKLETKRDVEGLIKALEHTDPTVRMRAVEALGRCHGPVGDDPIDFAVKSMSLPGVQALLRVLKGRVGPERTKDGMNPVVYPRDEDPKVRAAAAQALGDLGLFPSELLGAATVDDVSGDAALKAFESLGRKAPGAAGFNLIRKLFGTDYERWASEETGKKILNRLDPAFTAEILLASIEGDTMDHSSAVKDVIAARGNGAIAPCLKALGSESSMRRWVAGSVMRELDADRALDALVGALEDGDSEARKYAAASLGMFWDADRALNALVGALEDGDAEVRKDAVSSLGRFEDADRAIEALVRALEDEDGGVRGAAVNSLPGTLEEKIAELMTRRRITRVEAQRVVMRATLGDSEQARRKLP